MLVLPRLEVPLVPLLSENSEYNLLTIASYLQSLVGYCYSCNALITETSLPANTPFYAEGSFVVTATGFSGTAPSGTARHVRVGRQVTVTLPATLNGTSNSATFTLTNFPVEIRTTTSQVITVSVTDNGVPGQTAFVLAPDTSGVMSVNMFGGSFTSTGLKALLQHSITYTLP